MSLFKKNGRVFDKKFGRVTDIELMRVWMLHHAFRWTNPGRGKNAFGVMSSCLGKKIWFCMWRRICGQHESEAFSPSCDSSGKMFALERGYHGFKARQSLLNHQYADCPSRERTLSLTSPIRSCETSSLPNFDLSSRFHWRQIVKMI